VSPLFDSQVGSLTKTENNSESEEWKIRERQRVERHFRRGGDGAKEKDKKSGWR